jgi:hypothetical protein
MAARIRTQREILAAQKRSIEELYRLLDALEQKLIKQSVEIASLKRDTRTYETRNS